MLKPEQAKARLAEWQLPEESHRIAEGLKKLPERVRSAAETLFDLNGEETCGALNWAEKVQRRNAAATRIDASPAKQRARLFEVVSPRLALSMESTWQLLKTTPYQCGYERKAFRCPNHPQFAAERLGGWLSNIATLSRRYPPEVLTPQWLAVWAPHLQENYRTFQSDIGPLLAAVLNEKLDGADEVFEILRQSLVNQHDVGGMGRHVYTALLLSNRREGWELVEKTLLAAQRQEGLRQSILEAVDETHPEAFRRMLRLILDHELIRFSAVARAVDVWFGHLWTAASASVIKKMLSQVVAFLEDDAARDQAARGKDPEAAFLALWCLATHDAMASVAPAQRLLSSKSVELRFVAARHLANLHLQPAFDALIPSLGDEDLRVAVLALSNAQQHADTDESPRPSSDDRFEQIERLIGRLPEKSLKLKPLVWPWTAMEVKRSQVAACLLHARGKRPATRLIPHLAAMDTFARKWAVEQIVEARPWDAAIREAVIALAGDASPDVRGVVLEALQEQKLSAAEAERLERYLVRKAGDLRRGVLAILHKQPDVAALASAGRLLAAKDVSQRLAGLELLRLMTDACRSATECCELAAAYQRRRSKISKEEKSHLEAIVNETAAASLEDALGLTNPANRTPAAAPRKLNVQFITPAAVACLRALDDLVHQHREATVTVKTYNGPKEELLGNLSWAIATPECRKPRSGQEQNLPLCKVWKDWMDQRPQMLRDADGLELVRAQVWSGLCDDWKTSEWKDWAKKATARKQAADQFSGGHGPFKLKYPRLVGDILEWLLFFEPPAATDYILDVIETAYALVPPADMAVLSKPMPAADRRSYYGTGDEDDDWRDEDAFELWPNALAHYVSLAQQPLTPEQETRFWRLQHWRDEPFPGARRSRVAPDLLMRAYHYGAANLADVADHLLRPRGAGRYADERFGLLASLTERKRPCETEEWLARHPEVQALVDQAVARILEQELTRGDAQTAATVPAYSISTVWGIETLRRILSALGKADFSVGPVWRGQGDRRHTLTQLARVSFPKPDESTVDFVRVMRAAVKEQQFPEHRLLQLTFLAPQWTKCVEAHFGWEQMSEGVYWFLAHMRYVWGATDNAALAAGADDASIETSEESADDLTSGDDSAPKPKKLSAWERLILERTPLSDAERNEGAIDVAWFRRTHELLGEKRWQALADAARFAATAAQAKRAQFIANVLLNKVNRRELIDGIKQKQLKEHVRLLGLLPLAAGKKRDSDLIERCQVLREYRRYANQLSGLTKPAALRAWEIGMKNLAQTAGFPDPLRLEWAVGAEAIRDLANGPVEVSKDGVSVTLSLDELAAPRITIRKQGKELKAIPPAVKKDKKIVELTGRANDLKRQASAARQSLEFAMCRGDTFTGDELRSWCGHALLAPLLSRLVLIGEGIMGYPDKGGKALRDCRGKLEPVKPSETLRLAHSYDLLESGDWHEWQRECFRSERVQPFKQVFRELYVLTRQEKKDGAVSHRYDGQQVQPRQALALFSSRGWNTGDGVFKVFHDAELTAGVYFQSGATTPLEVEGATLAGVSFTRRDEWKPIKLSLVPPRLFSEVMRDLDLVVSVAHSGGVDPEASASTVEMRANLLRETCSLLNLKNVRLKAAHALIDGKLADYSVHLGSGTVHRLPGGALCIVPVHAQHRGRLFLPFADDDPRTAEVVSKVLLLARDDEIQDSTILDQIRS